MKRVTILFAIMAFYFSVNAHAQGIDVAIKGYSPVSYFQKNKAEMGNKKYASTYKGKTYYFTNKSQKKIFDKKPEMYVPQYGGHCATGMTFAKKFPVNPKAFIVKDGKLFLFKKNEEMDTRKMWMEKNHEMMQKKADEGWMKINK